jgi:CDP-glucose 4,6-dehydratase
VTSRPATRAVTTRSEAGRPSTPAADAQRGGGEPIDVSNSLLVTETGLNEWSPSPDFWLHRSVAVTGGSGFAGSHLVEKLVELRADVVILVRDELTPRWRSDRPQVTVARGDVVDLAALGRMLDHHQVLTTFHLAGQNRPWVADTAPVPTFETNIAGTWCILEAARRSPSVGQVVVASSDAAYGAQPSARCTEDMAPLAVRPFEVSRATADMVATAYARTYGLPVVIGRCPTLFGPGDTDWHRLVPGVTRSLLEGRPPHVHDDALTSRDYLFVVDAAMSYLQLAEALAARPELTGEVFNFSAERPVTVFELVEMLQIGAGTRIEADFEDPAAQEVPVRHLSAAKAREVLSWRPQHTFEEAVLLTIQWYQRHLGIEPGPD